MWLPTVSYFWIFVFKSFEYEKAFNSSRCVALKMFNNLSKQFNLLEGDKNNYIYKT